jgi:hypothetical protein
VPTRLPDEKPFTPVRVPPPESIGVGRPVHIPSADEVGVTVK